MLKGEVAIAALKAADPGDIWLVRWGDAHHGDSTWYSWEEVAEYSKRGPQVIEQVGFFVAINDETLTLVSSHAADGTNAPWAIPRTWIISADLLRGVIAWP